MNDDFNYSRRETTTVDVGGVKMGSGYPVRVQSMTNTDTNDIEASAAQCLRIAQPAARSCASRHRACARPKA